MRYPINFHSRRVRCRRPRLTTISRTSMKRAPAAGRGRRGRTGAMKEEEGRGPAG